MKTKITEMLGIKYPIFQGGMAHVAEPPLVAAVSNAGGLGILTGSYYNPEQLLGKIREIKKLTDRPFALNFTPACQNLAENLEVCIQEKVTAVTYGKGRHTTDMVIDTVQRHGIRCLPVVGAGRQALRVEREGADGVVVSGFEGGGHVGRVSTMVLLPLVTSQVKIPVVAAGGFCDGKGLAAALVLGAQGIQMGTRFICTQESLVPENIKRRILEANEEDTLVTGHLTGLRCRVLRNKQAELFLDLEDKKAPPSEFDLAVIGKGTAAFVEGDEEWGSIWCGQVAGRITDIPTCQELIERIVAEAEQMLKQAMGQISA